MLDVGFDITKSKSVILNDYYCPGGKRRITELDIEEGDVEETESKKLATISSSSPSSIGNNELNYLYPKPLLLPTTSSSSNSDSKDHSDPVLPIRWLTIFDSINLDTRETLLGNFITDVIKDAAEIDIAIVFGRDMKSSGGGGISSGRSSNPIKSRRLLKLSDLPIKKSAVLLPVIMLSVVELVEVIVENLKNLMSSSSTNTGSLLPLFHLSGLEIQYYADPLSGRPDMRYYYESF